MFPALEHQFGSIQALQSCEQELQRKMRARGVFFGDGLLPTYAYAFVVSRRQIEVWARQAETLIAAIGETTLQLVDDPGFFEEMRLEPKALELVRVDPGYLQPCVLCRPDGLPVEGGMKFVEVNSDSPAMMMFIDLVAQCMLELDEFAWLRPHGKPASAADLLLESLLGCYREFGGTREPTFAITDWEGQKTKHEHAAIAAHFEARGHKTIVCDPRAFTRKDGALFVGDTRVDIVYRRALATELVVRQDDAAALLGAYKDHEVCMVNPLRSYLGGAKSVLSHLTAQGAALIPRTVLLDNDEARQLVASSPSRWVLKRSFGHGGAHVILPEPANEQKWHAALAATTHEAWIAQEYLVVPKLTVDTPAGKVEKYFNWNPFVFGGRYAGGLVRVSSSPLINITAGGGLLPTFST